MVPHSLRLTRNDGLIGLGCAGKARCPRSSRELRRCFSPNCKLSAYQSPLPCCDEIPKTIFEKSSLIRLIISQAFRPS